MTAVPAYDDPGARRAHRIRRLRQRLSRAERALTWWEREEAAIRAHSGDALFEFEVVDRQATVAGLAAELAVWEAS